MERFLTLSYWLTRFPNPDFKYTKLSLAIGLLLILCGVALNIYRKKKVKEPVLKKMLKKYPGKLELFGFILLVLLYFRKVGIPYLAMRIWWLIWLITS